MRVKYNRVSTLQQNGRRFTVDDDHYDLILLDRVSGSVPFKDRPKGKELAQLIEDGKVTELVIEEFSRLGRNTGDCIQTLEWLDEKGINVTVRNLGIRSRPNGEKNPIWKMMSTVLSSVYELELENIRERTMVGRQVYIQNGGVIGRPTGTEESESDFIKKDKIQKALKSLKKGLTVRETAKVVGLSTQTVMKAKKVAVKHRII